MTAIVDPQSDRVEAAIQLHAREFVPWPLRYSYRDHGIENRVLLRSLRRPGASLYQLWIAASMAEVLASFEHPCNLEILTGRIGGTVAVSAWTALAQAWMNAHLPDTGAFLFTPTEDYLLYRAPGAPVESRHVIVDPDVPGLLMLRVSGEWSSVPVPEMAYAQLGEWPALQELPVFDPAWMPGALR